MRQVLSLFQEPFVRLIEDFFMIMLGFNSFEHSKPALQF